MIESSDKDSKKVHLIKQSKQTTPEIAQEQIASPQPASEQSAEKKKVVVVVKKKVVTTKKVQAKSSVPETHTEPELAEASHISVGGTPDVEHVKVEGDSI
jgi:hypothetical protein